MQKCYKCGSKQIVKNGKVFGWQRYKCKECGYQFTKNAPAGKPLHIKLLAHTMYSAGFSMQPLPTFLCWVTLCRQKQFPLTHWKLCNPYYSQSIIPLSGFCGHCLCWYLYPLLFIWWLKNSTRYFLVYYFWQ